ncbi:MAG: hypothetical protein M1820_005054 [Bogoriella megaspora]|nr:MAG: hypothetical protein M1820_005054 [Bogoriella megaspora]
MSKCTCNPKFSDKAAKFVSACEKARININNSSAAVGALENAIAELKAQSRTQSRWLGRFGSKKSCDSDLANVSSSNSIMALESLILTSRYDALVAVSQNMSSVRSLALARIWPDFARYLDPSEGLIHQMSALLVFRHKPGTAFDFNENRINTFLDTKWSFIATLLAHMIEYIPFLTSRSDFDIEAWSDFELREDIAEKSHCGFDHVWNIAPYEIREPVFFDPETVTLINDEKDEVENAYNRKDHHSDDESDISLSIHSSEASEPSTAPTESLGQPHGSESPEPTSQPIAPSEACPSEDSPLSIGYDDGLSVLQEIPATSWALINPQPMMQVMYGNRKTWSEQGVVVVQVPYKVA